MKTQSFQGVCIDVFPDAFEIARKRAAKPIRSDSAVPASARDAVKTAGIKALAIENAAEKHKLALHLSIFHETGNHFDSRKRSRAR